jgi:hypothetical protein
LKTTVSGRGVSLKATAATGVMPALWRRYGAAMPCHLPISANVVGATRGEDKIFTFKPWPYGMYAYTHQANTHTHTHNASAQVDARRTVGDVQVRKVKGGTLDAQGQARLRALVMRKGARDIGEGNEGDVCEEDEGLVTGSLLWGLLLENKLKILP